MSQRPLIAHVVGITGFWLIAVVLCLNLFVSNSLAVPENEQAKKLVEAEKESPESPESPPKYIVTIYSAGKIVETFETDKFEFESQPRTSFYGKNGKVIHVLASGGSTTVVRETDTDDLAAIRAEHEKTKKLEQLLALKRQEQAIKKEIQDRSKLESDLKDLDDFMSPLWTDEQQKKIDSLWTDEQRKKMGSLLAEYKNEMDAILNAEQRKEVEKMRKDLRDKMKSILQSPQRSDNKRSSDVGNPTTTPISP